MTYSQIVRYATVITKNPDIAKDIVHDFYLRLYKQGEDIFDKPKNFIYLGLSRTYINYWRKFERHSLYNNITHVDMSKMGLDSKNEEGKVIYMQFPEILECIDTSPNAEQLAISGDLINQARKAISIGYWDDYHHVLYKDYKDNRAINARKAARRHTKEQYLEIFDLYVEGLYTTDIAKRLNVPQQYVNHYKTKIRKWIAPILKG